MESDETLFELQYQFHNDIDISIEINALLLGYDKLE